MDFREFQQSGGGICIEKDSDFIYQVFPDIIICIGHKKDRVNTENTTKVYYWERSAHLDAEIIPLLPTGKNPRREATANLKVGDKVKIIADFSRDKNKIGNITKIEDGEYWVEINNTKLPYASYELEKIKEFDKTSYFYSVLDAWGVDDKIKMKAARLIRNSQSEEECKRLLR